MDNFESFYSNTALELRWFLISKYFPIIYSGLSHQTNILSLAFVESDTKNINKNQHKSSWLAFKKDLSVVAWGSRARWEKVVYNFSSIIQSSARKCITTSVHFATHVYVMLPTLNTPSSQLHYSTPCKTLSRLSMSSGGSQLEIVGYSQSLPINHSKQHAKKNLNVSKSGKKEGNKIILPTLATRIALSSLQL